VFEFCENKGEDNMKEKEIAGGVVHEVPMDLQKALTSDLDALKEWNNITPLARNEWICWTISVKKPETRANHIERVCSELKEGIHRPCCWPGCPHRKATPSGTSAIPEPK